MNILFDMNHPADVHQFKFVIKELQKKHKVIVVARNKECTYELLKANKIKFIPRKGYDSIIGKIGGILLINFKLYKIAKKFKPDIFVGSSGNLYVAQVGKILKKPVIIFDDTEHATFQKMLCFPFASTIVTPDTYKQNLGKKQIKYPGSKELSYLDKKYFKPDDKIEKEIKKKNNQKIIFLRLVSWEANHDLGKKGINNPIRLIEELNKFGKVLVSSEKKIDKRINKYSIQIPHYKLHDFLYFSDLVISEGGTVAVEAATLGIPTIYVNKLRMGYSDNLVNKGLIKQITDEKKIIETAKLILTNNNVKKRLNTKIDLVKFMSKLIIRKGDKNVSN